MPDSDVGIRDTEYILGGSRHQLVIGVTYVSQPGLGIGTVSHFGTGKRLLLLPKSSSSSRKKFLMWPALVYSVRF